MTGDTTASDPAAPPLLAILCPVHNEEQTIPLFFEQLQPVLAQIAGRVRVRLVFINNASDDGSIGAVQAVRQELPETYLITLSRNEGYQRAVECGLRNVEADLYVVIDVDCEDPPHMIPQLLAGYEEGYEVVYGERIDRPESWLLKAARNQFYRITRLLADEDSILYMAEFSLIDRAVRDVVIQDQSSFPFIRGSIARSGFRRKAIPYRRELRIHGKSHYNLRRMAIFAVAGILSSTTMPLRLPVYTLPFLLLAYVALGLAALTSAAVWAIPALLVLGLAFLSGTAAFACIYIARIYKNTLGRPNHVIDRRRSMLPP